MKTKTTIIVIALLTLLAFAVSLAVYPMLPERVASHWDAQGEVNGYSSSSFGAFFLPGLLVVLGGILIGLPAVDPLRKNIAIFRSEYNLFIVFMVIFMVYIHGLTLAWNLGYRFDITTWMTPAFAGLMYLVGVMLGKAKRNYFIGIRTPWTLQSDTVWDKTHARGALAFKVVAVISLLGIFFPHAIMFVLFLPILVVTLYLVVYSYLAYRQEENGMRD